MIEYHSLFFRFVNSGIILFLGLYLFYEYAWKAIKKGLQQKSAHKDDINKQLKEARDAHAKMVQQAREQKAFYTDLQHKVKIWQHALHARAQIQGEETNKHAARSAQRVSEQSKQYALQKKVRQIATCVFQETEAKLTAHFAQQEAQNGYLSSLLEHMEKGRS